MHTRRDATLIVAALTRFSVQFESADSHLADEAWALAVAIAHRHNLRVGDVTRRVA